MAKQPRSSCPALPEQVFWGANIPMRVIRRFARRVAECFHPEKIILLGSYASGTPHPDSDVDILVIMPTRNKHSQAVKTRAAIPAPFPMDLLVRTPQEMTRWLAEGERFVTAVVSKGKVLYETGGARVGKKSQADFRGARSLAGKQPPVHDLVCFHCQQCAEKYLKALLEELGIAVTKTHDLDKLRTILRPHHPALQSLRRGLLFLTDFAVGTRYPGNRTTKRQAAAALRWTDQVRRAARALLGLRVRARRRRRS